MAGMPSDAPPAPLPAHAGAGALTLRPGQFFGRARLRSSSRGIQVSHRIAEGPPDSVVTHTHADLHFILVSAGQYVSAAGPQAGEGPVLVYNPVGTTHRDHFEYGRGSFFSISLAARYLQDTLAQSLPPAPPSYLHQPLQRSLARSIAACCARDLNALTLEALCLELLGTLGGAGEPAVPAVPSRSFGLPPGAYRAVAGAAPGFQIDKTAPAPWRRVSAAAAQARTSSRAHR